MLNRFVHQLFIGLFLGSLVSSCTQKEIIVVNEHIIDTITNNTAPPFNEITTLQLQNYINRFYIDLLGREPLNAEMEQHTVFLKENNVSSLAIDQVVDAIFSDEKYFVRLHEIYMTNYLPGVDQQDIITQGFIFQNAQEDALQAGENILAQIIQVDIDNIENLKSAPLDFADGTINISEYMQRLCTNQLYDNINMGSENFTISCFENFLKRYPTDAELAASVNMIDGFPSQLLFRDGTSKTDFVIIVTQSDNFFEGLAIDIYQQLLARRPSSPEMSAATDQFKQGGSYQSLQKTIIKTSEYRGF